MDIFTWVLQILLALWEIVGGVFLADNYQLVLNASVRHALPGLFWVAFGVVQILLAFGLLVPGSRPDARFVAPVSAVFLALLSLAGIGLYGAYAGFPGMLWGIIPAALLAFIAYARFTPRAR